MKRHWKDLLVLLGFILIGFSLVAVASWWVNLGAAVPYR